MKLFMRPVLLASLAALLVACGEKASEPAAKAEAQPATQAEATQAAPAAAPATEAAQAAPAADKEALVAGAKASVQALGGNLKTELESAMQAGGPIAALDACNLKAPEISAQVSGEKGMDVTRVSLKPRNPTMGVPNEWQTKVLNDFDARKAAGETPDTLVHAEVADGEFRFMKAIPTGGLCLTCHGEIISPDVSAKLKELYPDDKAIGYKEGDLRGAFVVVKQITP